MFAACLQHAHSIHTYRCFVHDFLKIYSVRRGCVQPKYRVHITVFFDIVWKYVSRYCTCTCTYCSFVYDLLYMICSQRADIMHLSCGYLFYIYSVGTGCVQQKERVNYCVFLYYIEICFFPNWHCIFAQLYSNTSYSTGLC